MKNRFAKIIFVRLRKIVCSGSQNATSLAASKKSQKKRCFFSAQDHCTSLFGRRGGGPQKILDEPFMPWKLQTAVTPWGFAPQNHTKASLIHVWVNHLYSKIFMIRENPPRCFFFLKNSQKFPLEENGKPEVLEPNSKGVSTSPPKSHRSGNPKALITSRVWKEKALDFPSDLVVTGDPQAGS